ncbi:O-antigen ligase family protein [Acinetobacter baumannii]|uniref:Oligosaccharide-unit polymerase n=1 Tax=Acinetobacter baumannii TaxID=470 RepID=A0A7S8IW48_ACIBA|nr:MULTISPECIES: O-antigen ligase family protein [Acinetobacter calcoaceticus/baumannii complex]KMV26001.1 O-Antigen ligase family protein [Acinetobacter baumannii]MCT9270379.1 O-antigen ligase family protein [Acinetobacter baumannii]MDN8319312.1 O-antigen ligase family protein [Acinetobacter baumannii]QPD01064.1 oligosaccharide-unit polymerase [Acinetobacter baumannii]
MSVFLIKKNLNFQSIIQILVVFYIFSVVIMPSGTIGSINIKLMSIGMLSLVLFLDLISKKNISKKSLSLFLIFLFSLIFVALNYITSSYFSKMKGYSLDESILFITYFFSTSLLSIIVIEKIVNTELILKSIFYSSLVYACIKLLLTLLSFVNILPIQFTSEFIFQVFKVQPMLFPITENLSRLQLANDYIICFVLFFMISMSDKFKFLGRNKLFIYFFILLFCVLVSFSRYMMIVLFLAISFYIVNSFKFTLEKILSFFIFFLVLFFIYFQYMDIVNNFISIRFSNDTSGSSDSTRQLQVDCLLSAFQERPLLGYGGMGDYSLACPGPYGAEFSYEVQYLGYLFRFGIFQTLLIVVIYFTLFSLSINRKFYTIENFTPLLAFVVWMTIGFFNPYLVSSYASIIVILCVVMTYSKKNDFQ